MSLTARLVSRATGDVPEDQAAAARLTPKDRGLSSGFGVRRSEAPDDAPQDMAALPRRQADAPEDAAQPRRAEEEDPVQARRTEEDDPVQAHRSQEEDTTAAQPRRRAEEEETLQPRRAEDDDAQPQRAEDDDAAHPRRAAAPEDDAAPLRRAEEEDAPVQPRRAEDDDAAAQPRRSDAPPEDPAPMRADLPPHDAPVDELRHDQAGASMQAMRDLAPAPGPQTGALTGPAIPAPIAPVAPIAPPVTTPDATSVQPAATAEARPKVIIDQIDVVVAGDTGTATHAPAPSSARALLTRRYQRRL